MPRNGSGTYSLPQSPFVAGSVISSAAMNSDLSDIAAALTASLPRDGQAGMSGQLRGADGSTVAPAISFSNEPTTGFFRVNTGQIGFCILGNLVNTIGSNGILGTTPIGTVIDFAGSSAPVTWLLCYGQAVSRTTYAALFAVIGTAYGIGDGVTTFNIPDLRGRLTAGLDNMGGSASGRLTTTYFGADPTVLGNSGGAQSYTVLLANLPPYTPTGTVPITDPGHFHSYNYPALYTHQDGTQAADVYFGAVATNTDTKTTGITAAFNGAAQGGTSTPFSTISPTLVMNKIIFAGV